MDLTMNQANYGLGNGNLGWNLPEFGIQKLLSGAIENVFHTIHHSFDYKGEATTREVVTFAIFAVLMQAVLIPTETYTTVHANMSMMLAAGLTDMVACVLPALALVVRWIR